MKFCQMPQHGRETDPIKPVLQLVNACDMRIDACVHRVMPVYCRLFYSRQNWCYMGEWPFFTILQHPTIIIDSRRVFFCFINPK